VNYVTIDFSLNSPGICVFNESIGYTFISYLKPKSGTKKDQKLQEDFGLLKGAILKDQPEYSKNKEYSSSEFAKIERYMETANSVIELIYEGINPDQESIFAFEGVSFGSKQGTNNIIDMAAAAAILKLRIIEEFDPKTIQTLAPSTIKKFAGKGNMNKIQLWEVFLKNEIEDEYIESHAVYRFCREEIGEVTKIPKPFDDLVDAYFLNNLVRALSNSQA
jgi:hypothetical protein